MGGSGESGAVRAGLGGRARILRWLDRRSQATASASRCRSRGLHSALVKVPALHEVAPDGVNPCLHVGLHVFPEASAAVQSPLAPFIGAALASHGLGVHCAAAILPAWQNVLPFTVYPGLQTGVHVEPEAKVAVQLPFAPLVGG